MDTFNQAIHKALANVTLRRALEKSTSVSQTRRWETLREIPNWQRLREEASKIRSESIRRLPVWVHRFTQQAKRNGMDVHYARTAEEARSWVLRILQDRGVRRVVKSKSMATEEIDLNPALEAAGLEVLETDLGEFILQLAHEPPSHITAPALHKTRHEIADLFRRTLGYEGPEEPEALTRFARETLRQAFFSAEAGITGANFLIAETGSVVVVENEGNARLTLTLPPLHIVVAGIDKVIPRWRDAAPLLRLLAPSATGQIQTTYVSVVSGPEPDPASPGPQEIHILLVDHGRSQIATHPEFWEILKCIRCGACSLACPVFQVIGGQAYRSVYSGPVGIVLSPLLFREREDFQRLPFLSSLCGACREVCPVDIDLPTLILKARQDAPSQHSWPLKMFLRLWTFAMTHPRVYNWGAQILSPRLVKIAGFMPFLRPWIQTRKIMPRPRRHARG